MVNFMDAIPISNIETQYFGRSFARLFACPAVEAPQRMA